MEIALTVAITAVGIGIVLMTILYLRERGVTNRYKDIRDIDDHKRTLEKQARAKTAEIEELGERVGSLSQQVQDLGRKVGEGQEAINFQERSSALQGEIAERESKISGLKSDLLGVEDALEIQSFGLYEPRYGFDSSSEYAERLKGVREEQKALIREKGAAHCPTEWTVDGSKAKGRMMTNRQMKLMLRAFNGECDAAIDRRP